VGSRCSKRDARLEPQQHQLLLAIHGLPPPKTASIGEMADLRRILVSLTKRGDRLLSALSALHWTELRSTGPDLVKALMALTATQPSAKEGEG
jgi:hypothetical protein